MVNIILSGCNGRIGKVITNLVANRQDCKIACGVDLYTAKNFDYDVYATFSEVPQIENAVIIDFSNPSVLSSLLDYAQKYSVPCVLCTTGYSNDQIEQIKSTSNNIAIFSSGNMSLGINLTIALAKKATAVLGDNFDIEIIEKHHNQKLDAPSGTAIMIADAISKTLKEEPQYIYDRHNVRKKRGTNEIGIHSVRGGTIVGEHEVIFAGHDEILSIKHSAQSREVFAVGAINAAIYMLDKKSGMYDMSNILA